ncbi:MAG: hypothetical protein EZS28_007501, partial [Streblomastix strix]
LRIWWERTGKKIYNTFEGVRSSANTSVVNIQSKLPRYTFLIVKQQGIGTIEKQPDFFSIIANPVTFQRENMFYNACPNEKCGKKVDGTKCQICGEVVPTVRYIVNVLLCDHTGSAWVYLFAQRAEDFFKMKAGMFLTDLSRLEKKNPSEFYKIKNDCLLKPRLWKIKAALDNYQGQNNVKYTCISVDNVLFSRESREILLNIFEYLSDEEKQQNGMIVLPPNEATDVVAKMPNLDPCLSNNPVSSGSCQCTFEFHPDGCACNLYSYQQYSLEQALGCLRSIPLTAPEKSTTIDLLKNYLSGYVFLDTSLNPSGAPIGYGKHDVDIMGSLDAIGSNESYTNTFDFYEDIMVLLNKLKDPHTIFTPPCVSKFYYGYYYSIDVRRDSIDTPYYVMIDNHKAEKINMNGLPVYSSGTTENEGTMDPIEAISRFAEEEVPISRNPSTRFNSAAGYDFRVRRASLYKHPEHGSISFSYKEGSNIRESTEQFHVRVAGNINQLKDECPIHSDHSTSAQSNNQIRIMDRIKTRVKQVWNGMKQKFNGTMKKKNENDVKQQQQQQIQKFLKDLEEEQTKITQELEDRIRHKDLFSLIEEKIEILNNFIYAPYPSSGNPEVMAYRLTNEKVVKQFTNKNDADNYVERLIIDVRGNGGGSVVAGRQTLNYLFPQVGHPLYQTVDEMKTDINEQMAKLTSYITEYQYNIDEVVLDIETLLPKPTYYTQSTIKRTTASKNSSKTLTVDLTDKFVMYKGNSDDFLQFTADWDLKRKDLFSPENVLVISDGNCASACSQFVKHIGLKHLGRIAGIGISDPYNSNARFDIGMASSTSIRSVDTVQTFKGYNYDEYFTVDKNKLPKNLYRVGSKLTWSNKGGYGFTEDSKELLLEYAIVDPDFRVEYQPQDTAPYYDEEDQRILLYLEVLSEEDKLLVSTTGESKKCFSWEVDVSGAESKGNCKKCVKDDQHTVFGHPCSSRGQTEADGTSKIGIVDSESCVFSHCKVGYYRKNVDIGSGIFKNQCIQIPLGPNQLQSDITPDKSEDIVSDSDICSCSVALIGTPGYPNICPAYCTSKDEPTSDCVCNTESTSYPVATCQSEKKCTVSSIETVDEGSCTCSESNYPQGCKCPTIPSELTGISKDRCPCLASGDDPRADGICSAYCTSKDEPTSDCVCNNESTNYSLSTCQYDKLCTVLTGKTPSQCACTGDSDPRLDCICTSHNTPNNCKCSNESTGNYTKYKCEKEERVSLKTVFIIIGSVVGGVLIIIIIIIIIIICVVKPRKMQTLKNIHSIKKTGPNDKDIDKRKRVIMLDTNYW